MADANQARLPVGHVIAHDGSRSAQQTYEWGRALTEELVVVFRDVAPPPGEADGVWPDGVHRASVPALTMDRILRTARSVGAPWVTIPSSMFSPERILLSTIDATARLATDSWPALAVHALRRPVRPVVDEVAVVATHDRSSGVLLLVATIAALLSGARLTKVVVGGAADERVRPGARGADADLAAVLQDKFELPTTHVGLPRRPSAVTLERTLAGIDAGLVVVGMGQMTAGLSHRDLTRDGRRRLLAGPLRVEHVTLRSMTADAVIVTDSVRLRRRVARDRIDSRGLGDFFLGDVGRFEEVVRSRRQARNHAAESGRS